jgi:hypothetical protein
MKEIQDKALQDKGIMAFEKYVKRIEWLHSEDKKTNAKLGKNYIVIDELTNEIVFSTDKMIDIEVEFCVSAIKVRKCIKEGKMLNDKYRVVRCK